MNARMSYIQSGRDIDSYREQLAMVQAQTQYSLMTQKQQYDYQKNEIDANITNLNNQRLNDTEIGWMTALNATTGTLQGAISGGNLWNNLFSK